MRDFPDIPQVPLRPPGKVMRLSRMGSMFPTRLSFLRTLIRRLSDEQARLTRPVWNICAQGFGHAVYSIDLGGHRYSLVAVSNDLPADARTDRVIATAWDTAYVLYDGVPDTAEIARICDAAPKQEAARFTERDLVLSRANKSVRLFGHVVDRLRSGKQPDEALVRNTGYLMRTTAVYGNGKFGIADRALYDERPGLDGPFMAEMLTVWMIRHFTHDLVEHIGGARLDRHLRRHLGIGNSTGLGMAPFLVNHPVLLNNWVMARETALARARAVTAPDTAVRDRLCDLARRAGRHLAEWQVPDAEHQGRIDRLQRDWQGRMAQILNLSQTADAPGEALVALCESGSEDLQELMAALVIEPFGDLVDGLSDCMSDPFGAMVVPFSGTAALRTAIDREFGWALGVDYAGRENCGQFWYVSAAKQEPRLGLRFEEQGAQKESPLDIARRISALRGDLETKDEPVSAFLGRHPEHALAALRVALGGRYPYAEIQDNLIAETCLPIDMLRCKLSFFGASKFDPKSDRWTRITLCQGAPLADELGPGADDWWLPVFAG
ncbi:hypothetical protein [uncultured Roseobacter sp.]|uniref:hypothetical protein n=1 Tax=uncultured Roseobacter sp. TaxID=114847 RepID=UPI002602C887|nr:hypothetical protein [uncultured Roseobacter sp.]